LLGVIPNEKKFFKNLQEMDLFILYYIALYALLSEGKNIININKDTFSKIISLFII